MKPIHTIADLKIRQSLPLDAKVAMTKVRIREWVDYWGLDGVYVSFSGGKDSTVLLHLVREMYPDVPAVFCDTGLEYPEIRDFVKTFENVTWLKPSMNFKQVIQKYGYPFISKEVSQTVYVARHSKDGKWKRTRMQRLEGTLLSPNGSKSRYNCERYHDLIYAPFDINDHCCAVMKKKPFKEYEKKTGRKVFLGQLADESLKRTQGWLKVGCNAFESKRPQSNPMSFWTTQDVLTYIKNNNLKIASVYGDIVPQDDKDQLNGQMDISEFGLIEDNRKLVTTGLERTGCMFCGYGCHLKENNNRFEKMKQTHPKQYEFIMKPTEAGGLNYKAVIDWMNENLGLDIKY